MDISRSGRIRKKSSKLADFESPDEIDSVTQIRKAPKISVSPLKPFDRVLLLSKKF